MPYKAYHRPALRNCPTVLFSEAFANLITKHSYRKNWVARTGSYSVTIPVWYLKVWINESVIRGERFCIRFATGPVQYGLPKIILFNMLSDTKLRPSTYI